MGSSNDKSTPPTAGAGGRGSCLPGDGHSGKAGDKPATAPSLLDNVAATVAATLAAYPSAASCPRAMATAVDGADVAAGFSDAAAVDARSADPTPSDPVPADPLPGDPAPGDPLPSDPAPDAPPPAAPPPAGPADPVLPTPLAKGGPAAPAALAGGVTAAPAGPAGATALAGQLAGASAGAHTDGIGGPPGKVIAAVIVTEGDLDDLDRSLDALSRQDLQAPYQVIVVDDDPDPRTARMVEGWATRSAGHGASFVYVPNHGAVHGLAAARNLGWRAASAPLLAFTGDDTVAAPCWLRQGLAAFGAGAHVADGSGSRESRNSSASGAASHNPAPPDAVCGRVEASLPRQPTEYQRNTYLRESGDFAACNWFCQRRVLDSLGGFDERFHDAGADADLYFRLLETGACLEQAPSATVAHPVPPSAWSANLAQLRELSSEALLYKKHPRLYRQKIRRPPDWHDVAVVLFLLLAVVAIAGRHEILAVAAGGSWLVLTAMLCIRRLRDTAKTPAHIAMVLASSPLLPPLALFWRLVGAIRYRVGFA